MARPIADTPILFGEDARRFEQEIAIPRTMSEEERRKMNEAYEWFKARATFPVL